MKQRRESPCGHKTERSKKLFFFERIEENKNYLRGWKRVLELRLESLRCRPQNCFLLFSLSENFLILDSLIPQDLTGWQEYSFGPSDRGVGRGLSPQLARSHLNESIFKHTVDHFLVLTNKTDTIMRICALLPYLFERIQLQLLSLGRSFIRLAYRW